MRAAAQSDCWFFPSSHVSPLFPLLLAIVLQLTPRARARAVVFHCCERMQIAIPVPGPSINSNRINSSAVIVFCASQKTLYIRGRHRFAPATNNIRFIRMVAHVADLSSPPATPCVPMVKSRLKIGPWVGDITSAIDHFIGNYRQRFASDVSAQRRASKKGLSNIASLIQN